MSVHLRAPVGTLAVGAKLERYEILAKLAAGGMASVYLARVQAVGGFERLVAIKVLHSNLAHEDEFIRMFLDEARLAASIRHPNVVPTIDVSDSKEAGCGYFIVMEYIEGDHLGALLGSAHKANDRLALPVVLRIVVDTLGGLGAAHGLCDDAGRSLNLVHRDVSPHNIMVGRDGVVRLTDFGVAKAEDRLTHTREGQVKGKLAYMAPEQAGNAATDARSDLFSVGVILWEAITGRRLFRADTTAGTLNKLLREPIPAPSSIDPALAPLDALLAKALARDAAERFQTADEFARAIEEAAPAVGGLASLRGVARMVKHYAAAKLNREKKLLGDALHALDPQAGAPAPAVEDELTIPSSSELSGLSASLTSTNSKPSGVFSHHTLPGNVWAAKTRTQPDTTSGAADGSAGGSGSARATQSLTPGLRSVELFQKLRTPGGLALCAGVLLVASYFVFGRQHSTQAEAPGPGMVRKAGLVASTVSTTTAPSTALAPPAPLRGSEAEDEAPLEEVTPRRASRARGERAARTTPRGARRQRKDSTVTPSAAPETTVAPDDVMPNPYHTR